MSHLVLHLDAQFDYQSTPAAQSKTESAKKNTNLQEPGNPCYTSIPAQKAQHLQLFQFTRSVRPNPFSSHCNQDAVLSEESSMASSSSQYSSSEVAASSFSSSITFTNHNGSIDCGVNLSNPCSTISKHATSQISATGFSPLIVDMTSAHKQGVDITFNSIDNCKSIQNSCSNSKHLEIQSNILEEKCFDELQQPVPAPLLIEEYNQSHQIHAIQSVSKQNPTLAIHGTFKSQQQTAAPPKTKKSNPFYEFVSKQRGILESKLQTLFTATTATTATSSSIGATTITQSTSSGSSATTFSRFLAGNKSHDKQQQQQLSSSSQLNQFSQQQHPTMLGVKKNPSHPQQTSQPIVRPFVTNERFNKQQPVMKLKGLTLPYNEKQLLLQQQQQQQQQQQPQNRILPVRPWEDLVNESKEDHLRYFEQETVNKRPPSHSRITAFSLNDSDNSSESQKCGGNGGSSGENARIDSSSTLGSSPSMKSISSGSTMLTTHSLNTGYFHQFSHNSSNINNNKTNNSSSNSSNSGNINNNNIAHSAAIPLIYLYSNPCVQSPKATVKELIIPVNSVSELLPAAVTEHAKIMPANNPLDQLELAKQDEKQFQQKQGKCELNDQNQSPDQSHNSSFSARENELLQTQKKGKSRDSVAYMLTRTNSLAKQDVCLTTSIAPVPQSIEQFTSSVPAIPQKKPQQSLPQSILGIKKRIQQQPFIPWNSLIAKKHLEAIAEKNRILFQKTLQQAAAAAAAAAVPKPNQSGQSSDTLTTAFAPLNLCKRIKIPTTLKAQNFFPVPVEGGAQALIKNANKIAQIQKPYVSAVNKPDFSKVVNKLYKNFATKSKVVPNQ